jgi:uncharacterized membrane protein YphA (DoxX/SURF4 family)
MSSFARKLPAIARIALGLAFTVFGLNFFVSFLPQPSTPPPAAAMTFIGALMGSGYLMTIVKVIEVAAGILLLTNRFVPLALTLLAPVVVNIVAFHAFLAPEGIPLVAVILVLEIYLAWAYRAAFAPMLRARVAPTAAPADDPTASRTASALTTG